MPIKGWFAYTLPQQDQYLNKAFMSKWKSFEQTCCSSLENCKRNGNERTDRRGGRLTDGLTALCRATFLPCWVMARCRSDTTFSADSQWLGNLECHTPSPIPGQAIQTAPASRGRKLNFPPSKTGLQIPINRSLEGLQSIKFHLPRWSGQSGSSFFYTQCVGMHECTRKHVRMHAEKTDTRTHKHTNAHTIKKMQTYTRTHTYTESYPSSQCPP